MALTRKIASERFYTHVWPYRAAVLRAARIVCRNDSDADDLAQDVLLKAFSGIETFQIGSSPHAWLMRILRNARIDRIRSTKKVAGQVSIEAAELDVPDTSLPASTPEWEHPEELLNAFSDAQIIDALQHLPEEIRMTLLLVEIEGMDHTDAASILDVPVGTIKSRSHRGRSMLRDALLPLARDLRLTK